MNETALKDKEALSTGSDLWILAPRFQSRWTRLIDWLSHLQVLKFEKRSTTQLSEELKGILKEEELEIPFVGSRENAPLIVSVSDYLPCRFCVILPIHTPHLHWLEELLKIWKNLEKPSTRVFFTDPEHVDPFIQAVKKHKEHSSFIERYSWTHDSLVMERSK